MKKIRLLSMVLLLSLAIFSSLAVADQNLQADVVVVGAGGSGIAAAYAVAQQGAQSVIVLEKTTFSRWYCQIL